MNREVVAHLNGLVDQYCHCQKIPVFGFDGSHRCNSQCKVIGSFPYFICVHSRQPHVCGRGRCTHTYTTNEGTFCQLTGFELSGPCAETSSIVVRDSCGKSTRHWGDKIQRGRRQRKRAVQSISNKSLIFFERAVKHFMFSEERQKMYKTEMQKFRLAAEKISKRQLQAPLKVREASRAISELVDHHLSLCSPPPPKDVRWTESLAKKIYLFWKQLDFKCTRKSVHALVAVSLSMMARPGGYAADNVLYVHHSPTVARHVVTDMQFGKFSGLTCRRMSIIQRELMKALLTPGGKQKIIAPLQFSAE